MKRLIPYLICAVMLSSCDEAVLGRHDSAGSISVGLMAEVPTRAYQALSGEEAAHYHIGVFNSDGTPAVYKAPEEKEGTQIPVTDYKDFETVTVALHQSYYVWAESCTVEESEIGNGTPRYEGSSERFELNASNIYQKVVIECSQTNAMVTVVFDSSVAGRFNGLKMTLTSGDRKLEIEETENEVVTYFTPASLTYSITGTYAETSFPVNLSPDPVTLEAKGNVRLIVKLDLTHGQAAMPSVSVTEEYAHNEDSDCEIDPYSYK